MKILLMVGLIAQLTQSPTSQVQRLTFQAPDGTSVRYGLAIPSGYKEGQLRPLVLALHPGGDKTPYYGEQFMRQIFLPGLGALDPIMVAPDCPTTSWTDPAAEQAVLALLDNVIGEYAVDRHRILVTGYSLGGRGTWFMSSRHADRFTAAIVMAARTEEPTERLATIPTYIIHSRRDEVVPFAQAAQRAAELERIGRTVKFEALRDFTHYEMRSYVPALQRAGQWVMDHWPESPL